MIKLLPNETVHCEWAGITITNSRIFIQSESDGDNFSLRQFPAEDYRGIRAVFYRSKLLKITAITLFAISVVTLFSFSLKRNPYDFSNVRQDNPKPVPEFTIYEINKELPVLIAKKEELSKKSFAFFKGTRLAELDKSIENETEKANQMIADLKVKAEKENAIIVKENKRRLEIQSNLHTEFESKRNTSIIGVIVGFLFSFVFWSAHIKSGSITLEIDFNKADDPVKIKVSGGKKNLEKALEFSSQVDNFLSPLNSKKNKVA